MKIVACLSAVRTIVVYLFILLFNSAMLHSQTPVHNLKLVVKPSKEYFLSGDRIYIDITVINTSNIELNVPPFDQMKQMVKLFAEDESGKQLLWVPLIIDGAEPKNIIIQPHDTSRYIYNITLEFQIIHENGQITGFEEGHYNIWVSYEGLVSNKATITIEKPDINEEKVYDEFKSKLSFSIPVNQIVINAKDLIKKYPQSAYLDLFYFKLIFNAERSTQTTSHLNDAIDYAAEFIKKYPNSPMNASIMPKFISALKKKYKVDVSEIVGLKEFKEIKSSIVRTRAMDVLKVKEKLLYIMIEQDHN